MEMIVVIMLHYGFMLEKIVRELVVFMLGKAIQGLIALLMCKISINSFTLILSNGMICYVVTCPVTFV